MALIAHRLRRPQSSSHLGIIFLPIPARILQNPWRRLRVLPLYLTTCRALLAWIFVAAIAYHFVMGIKHLFADMGMNEELKSPHCVYGQLVIAAILIVASLYGDVLMIKNNSGIKSATGLTDQATDWIVQRVSVIVLAIFIAWCY